MHPRNPQLLLHAPSCRLESILLRPCPSTPVCSRGGTTVLQKAEEGDNWCLSTTRLTPDEMIHEVMLKNDDKNNCSVNE